VGNPVGKSTGLTRLLNHRLRSGKRATCEIIRRGADNIGDAAVPHPKLPSASPYAR
jgi:hypothetical protein